MTHCSECRRRIREKRVPGGIGGNYANPVATGYTDWLGHSKDPMCSRYGQPPDAGAESHEETTP